MTVVEINSIWSLCNEQGTQNSVIWGNSDTMYPRDFIKIGEKNDSAQSYLNLCICDIIATLALYPAHYTSFQLGYTNIACVSQIIH